VRLGKLGYVRKKLAKITLRLVWKCRAGNGRPLTTATATMGTKKRRKFSPVRKVQNFGCTIAELVEGGKEIH
jgi:hypothetical protein